MHVFVVAGFVVAVGGAARVGRDHARDVALELLAAFVSGRLEKDPEHGTASRSVMGIGGRQASAPATAGATGGAT